jgi:DNA adenine methylase
MNKREDCVPPILDPSVPWPPQGWVRVKGEKMTEKTEHTHRSFPAAQPCVKWAGGKRALLPEILHRLPAKIGTYFEPFLGGGAVFFALAAEKRFKRAVLADSNEELITTYAGVASECGGVISHLKVHAHRHSEKWFYTIRASNPSDRAERAARMIYLNRTCFNGLYRVNRKGQFNVPFGKYTNPTICDEENLRAVSNVFRESSAWLSSSDFEKAVVPAKRGDTVYFDCPYAPASETASFTAYTAGGFGSVDQERLRDVARKLIDRGVHVLLSNSDTPFVRDLYKDFKLEEVQAPRRVNSKGSKRGNVGELLISGRTK